uniref:N-acetyltransferase domain-containing protein n=1 Tax=Chromera velia CCMP2878 TaxID=1169474 RepID=A0A0G4G6Y6_9ALVE|eukprot:Cvel_20442.t1-p1 / transcript=Cvel_20442.t1 / gene=Cvel_20442 / organism=Chromera_velia_CCMP2878 / gene_product=hypothetical protein / transcript_product=hypothetical protein / location=Cvel_scaffold1833:1022-4349(-) / protein_length=486 / sequence_SO=supercontig / SO=protein_coding / is_pseudo=false
MFLVHALLFGSGVLCVLGSDEGLGFLLHRVAPRRASRRSALHSQSQAAPPVAAAEQRSEVDEEGDGDGQGESSRRRQMPSRSLTEERSQIRGRVRLRLVEDLEELSSLCYWYLLHEYGPDMADKEMNESHRGMLASVVEASRFQPECYPSARGRVIVAVEEGHRSGEVSGDELIGDLRSSYSYKPSQMVGKREAVERMIGQGLNPLDFMQRPEKTAPMAKYRKTRALDRHDNVVGMCMFDICPVTVAPSMNAISPAHDLGYFLIKRRRAAQEKKKKKRERNPLGLLLDFADFFRLLFGLRSERIEASRISNLFVVPRARRQGIASLLCQEAEGAAREGGFRRVLLSVAEENDVAISLYKKRGFREICRETASFMESVLTTSGPCLEPQNIKTIVMEKHLYRGGDASASGEGGGSSVGEVRGQRAGGWGALDEEDEEELLEEEDINGEGQGKVEGKRTTLDTDDGGADDALAKGSVKPDLEVIKEKR